MMNVDQKDFRIVLIGAGIMSATLGIILKKLMPQARIKIFERLDKVGLESSAAWNNAGTGHSAFCELNYTVERADGSIDVSKALKIAEQFEISKQFWSYLIESGCIADSNEFINDIAHMSFVWGESNVNFLKKRHEAMIQYAVFESMKYTTDRDVISQWVPLMMEGRNQDQAIAATRMDIGTDVNFGSLTQKMVSYLDDCDGVEVHLAHEVTEIDANKDGGWVVYLKNLADEVELEALADFVFIGAGGGSLKLLEKSDIPECSGFGGFPVSGQWLKCTNKKVIAQHEAKVYGKAEVGAPPMSVPHLDTRMIDGERALLFGPYAGFSTKFLKNGSYMDLFLSIETHNVWPLLTAGYHNIPLTKYLIEQVMQSDEERFEALQAFYPTAVIEDWELAIAGQRVQVIEKDEHGEGVLKFGTEVVCSADGSMAALLGASPGASTSVAIMLDLISRCFPEAYQSASWNELLCDMIPSHGSSLIEDGELLKQIRKRTSLILGLN